MLGKVFRIALLLPAFWWLYQILTGDYGADPAKAFNHATGEIALYYLLGNLWIGWMIALRIRLHGKLRWIYSERRWLGVTCFFYASAHFFLYFAMEGFERQAFRQLATKPYLTLGFSAWILLLMLAASSNDFSLSRLGLKKWRRLHQLVHFAAALLTAHVLQIEKADLRWFGALFSGLWLLQFFRFLRSRCRKPGAPSA